MEKVVRHASNLAKLRPRVQAEEQALHAAIVEAVEAGSSRNLVARAADLSVSRVAQIIRRHERRDS